MKQRIILSIIVTGVLIAGCTNTQHEQALKDIKLQLADLGKKQLKTSDDLEQLNNRLVLLQEQLDISKRDIKELKTMAVPVAPPEELKVIKLPAKEPKVETKKEEVKKTEPKTESPPEPEELYNEAQNLFMAGRLSESAEQFARFIRHYPKHTLTDNAQYWIGETYYSQKDYQRAIVEFKKVVDIYPNENKAPDALLKMGYSYGELNNKEKAIESLKLVAERYPSSEAAAKARTKLQEIQK